MGTSKELPNPLVIDQLSGDFKRYRQTAEAVPGLMDFLQDKRVLEKDFDRKLKLLPVTDKIEAIRMIVKHYWGRELVLGKLPEGQL